MVMPLTTVQGFPPNSFGVAPSNDFRGILNSSFRAVPFEGILYSSIRAAPFEGIANSSLRAATFEGILYSSLRAAPFEGIANSSLRAVPFKGILYSSLQAAPFKGITNSSLRAAPSEGITNSSLRAAPFEGILYSSLRAAPFEGNPYCSSRAVPFEGVSVQTVPFDGIIAPAFRGILYCPLWVNCLNNIQGITSALSFCECSSLLPACWYLGDFFTQLMEVTWSYLSPIITILIEFLQKIIVWHNEFMWHWVISLRKTRNCTHLT